MKRTSWITWRIGFIILLDIILIGLADGLTLLLKYDFVDSDILVIKVPALIQYFLIQATIIGTVFWFRKIYYHIWTTITLQDVVYMCNTLFLAQVLICLCTWINTTALSVSTYFLSIIFQFIFLIGARCIPYLAKRLKIRVWIPSKHAKRMMLVHSKGSGDPFIREMKRQVNTNRKLCCILDYQSENEGKYLHGVPIIGGFEHIHSAAKAYEITDIVVAIPENPELRRQVLSLCKKTHCKVQILPEFDDLFQPQALLQTSDITMNDLLERSPIRLDANSVSNFLNNKTVLVTGGGGSIGSELCRQIVKYQPKCVIALDIYENSVYEVQQELKRTYGNGLNFQVEIASIRDKERVEQIFAHYQPDVVFHAAAHKHVPLMEHCPAEAIKNNVFGTYHVVRAAEKFKTKKFVMISTDKAVNPTNFMGATKRFCEMILQSRNHTNTEFCAVRFGNVLGSNGSVVPLFKQQIESGGPLTITDKRIVRYFMTIPEAVMLVLEAGAMAKQGEIFVLDMGKPVKILALAENLIWMSGLEPYKDIEIKEIGLRPGEKLYEELLMNKDNCIKTANRKIFIEKQQTISEEEIMNGLTSLDESITAKRSNEALIQLMKQIVPTFCNPEEVNQRIERV